MAKRLTVFYSWQSDTPSSVNRSFIEKALHNAIERLQSDATLESALRDSNVELDKDTKGVAGSPPITDTILKKIEECAVFVADLTFVAQSPPGRPKIRFVSNPNVLIEYGFALRCHSHKAIVGVMNSAFGEPTPESLPFNLRHLRQPITFNLPGGPGGDRQGELEKLTKTLTEALRSVLAERPTIKSPVISFVPRKSTNNAALFHEDINDLTPDGEWGLNPNSFTIPNGGKAYLRLYPSEVVAPFESELEALEAAARGGLRPLGRISGFSTSRNVFGAIAFEAPANGKLYHFTQLFLSREIWSVDLASPRLLSQVL